MSYEVWGGGDEPDYEHLLEAGWWASEQVDEVKDAIKALRAEPVYEGGNRDGGISLRFLMRITLLEVAAGLRDGNDPLAMEARAAISRAQGDTP